MAIVLSLDWTAPQTSFQTAELIGADSATVAGNEFENLWADPVDRADYEQGAVCATTKIWAPGHALVEVEGRKHIAEFAPVGDPGRYDTIPIRRND